MDNVDHLSLPAVALGGSLVFALAWKWRLPPVSGALASILVTLLLYKLGHPQFFLVVPLSAGLWYAQRFPHRDQFLNNAMIACLGWIAFLSSLYLLTHIHNYYTESGATAMRGRWDFLRDWLGLPTFVFLATMLVALMRHERLRMFKPPDE